MSEGNIRASMDAVRRDVAAYASDLDRRISALRQSALQSESEKVVDVSSHSSVATAQAQLDEITAILDRWEAGNLEAEARQIDSEIRDFVDRRLPEALEPYRKRVSDWKARFNESMTRAGARYQEIDRALSRGGTDAGAGSGVSDANAKVIGDLARDVDALQKVLKGLSAEVRGADEAAEGGASVAGLVEQLKVEVARARATADAGSEAPQRPVIGELASSFREEAEARRREIEQRLTDLMEMFETAERDWESDLTELDGDVHMGIARVKKESTTEQVLDERIEEARAKLARIEGILAH